MRTNEAGFSVLRFLSVAMTALMLLGARAIAAPPAVKITYLYDNTAATTTARPEWGFAALIEAHGQRLIFDTGGDEDVLQHNLTALGVDLRHVNAVVLSHAHWDHTQGIAALGRQPDVPAYFPQGSDLSSSSLSAIKQGGMKETPISEMTEVHPRIWVSHPMYSGRLPEIALVIDTDDGLVVIVGCAHPGPIAMVTQIKEQIGRPVLMLVGGFHMLKAAPDTIDSTIGQLRALGVAYVGSTHCTGEAAIKTMREAYGTHFLEGGVGTIVEVPIARRTALQKSHSSPNSEMEGRPLPESRRTAAI